MSELLLYRGRFRNKLFQLKQLLELPPFNHNILRSRDVLETINAVDRSYCT